MALTCTEVRPLIDQAASGDLGARNEIAGHTAGCTACSNALALAVRLEQVMGGEPPAVPQNFTNAVMRRVRRDWWQSEQNLDLWFNVAIGCALLLVSAGIWMLINLSGLTAVTVDASSLLMSGARALSARIVPSLPTYAAATTILVGTFALWWWAERGME